MPKPSSTIIPRGIPFAQIPHACNLDPAVTNAGYRVYGFLMKLANSGGRAWPGHRYIEDELPLSRNTIAAAIKNLEETGWIEVDRTRQAHRYVIHGTLDTLDLDYSNRRRNSAGAESEPAQKVDQTGSVSAHEPAQKLSHIDTHDRQPEQRTSLATRNVAWEWLTTGGFGMAATTATTKKRVGKLARELNAKLDAAVIGDRPSFEDALLELNRRARTWAQHFPDATLTPDAFVKHFELLGHPPLRQSEAQQTRDATMAAVDSINTS